MRRLLAYAWRFRTRYLLGATCLLATATIAMAIPYLLKLAIDGIAAGRADEASTYVAVIVGLAIGQGFVRTLSRALIFNVGRDIECTLRDDLFSHLLTLPVGYYQNQRTGDLMSRLINDVTAVRMMLGPGILNLVNTPVYYAYGLAMMASLDLRLTTAALLPYPLLLWAGKRLSRALMENTLGVQQALSDVSALVQENITGMHVVRAYDMEAMQGSRFEVANQTLTQRSLKLAETRGRLMPVMKMASGSGTLVVLGYGGMRVLDGALSIGDLVAFLGYLNLLAWPTMALGWMMSIIQRGRASMQRLDQILSVLPEVRSPESAYSPTTVKGEIEFRHVSFRYDPQSDRPPAIDALDLRLPAGTKFAIVGRTGSGKSTVANLIPRVFDVTDGAISVDGVDLRQWSLPALRRAIAMVPQEPFLFSATIRANLMFARDAVDEPAMRDAAKAAGILDDIERLPNGFDTVVGERGLMLSGGQKQRITLARALLAQPRILVLDDALSSVDTRTERAILDSLRRTRGTRTEIVIAHRLSTIVDADQIVVLDRGRIAERGTHEQLLARRGIYFDLFQEQQLEQEIDAA